MSKELQVLEALERITEHLELDSDYFYTQEKVDEDTIKQSLKALEIIKEKNVCISVLKDSDSFEEYNNIVCYHKTHTMAITTPLYLEKEEWDLLKEVLL